MPMDSRQLIWRCRRGVRELDVLFGRFLENHYPSLDDRGRETFEQLLDVQDPVIMDWLFNREQPDNADMRQLIQSLQSMAGLNKG